MANSSSKQTQSRATDSKDGGQRLDKIAGDPGVGGLLAAPLEQSEKAERKPSRGAPSPDPEPPRAHGDWAPTHKWRGRAGRTDAGSNRG